MKLSDFDIPRFWNKVEKTTGCWIWLGCTSGGYGLFGIATSKSAKAHRIAYEIAYGPIPDGLQIDHLCRNPTCVNPCHLEAVTQKGESPPGNGRFGGQPRQDALQKGA